MSGSGHTRGLACKKVAEDETAAHLIVIAFSAGGLVPVRRVLSFLPRDLPAAVIVAQHVRGVTYLPTILKPHTRLAVKLAEAEDRLLCGNVYVAPPDQHIVVSADGRIQLANRSHLRYRPSADWLFESAAGSFAERTVAVVLSGRMSDGARGVVRVKRAGGCVFAQEPASCRFPDMPNAAIRSGAVDATLAPEHMGSEILRALHASDVAQGAHRWREPFASALAN